MKSNITYCVVLAILKATALAAEPTVSQIAAGGYHSLFLKSDGSLWAMGYNNHGQLGDGTTNNADRPKQIVASNVVAIAAGSYHSLFTKSDGSLWAMGDDHTGQLGDGQTYGLNGTNRPVQIVASNVVAIAAALQHSLFIRSDGSLCGMGDNNFGELGDGTSKSESNRPEQILSSNVVAVAAGAGADHSLFLKSDGSLWAAGYNFFGQLGDGTFDNTNGPQQIVSNNVTAIAAAAGDSLFLLSDGSLWGMGVTVAVCGALGDGGAYIKTNRPEEIVAGNVTSIAVGNGDGLFTKSDGSLWAMGCNDHGQLGDGTLNLNFWPEQVVSSNAVAAAEGYYHGLFIKSDGSLWGMGGNQYGQLGDGFTNDVSALPEQIVPPPRPIMACGISSGTNLQIQATCRFGGTYYLLTSPDLTQPLSQWTTVSTNLINNRATNNFDVTLSNALTSGAAQQFFMLRSQ